MKKTILLLLSFLILLMLSACNESENHGDAGSKPSVNFDLSQYDSHGELSCGRIWVVKTISDWDTRPAKYFAYLDADGNVIYDWTPVGEVYYRGAYVDAMLPQNFVNDRAMIINRGFGTTATQSIILIDHNGNELYSPSWIYVEFYEQRNREREYYITNFDKEGYAYFIGRVWWDGNTEGDYGVYWMDDAGIHKFNAQLPTTDRTLHAIERMDKYYFIAIGAYSILFDFQGNPIVDFKEAAGIFPDSIEIIDDKYIEASFIGKDDKRYVCVLDFDGNFIKSPVLKSEYVRNETEWVGITNPSKQTLIVGISPYWAPFSYYENGELTGFDIDLIKLIANKLGCKLEFKIYNFENIITAVSSNEVDLAIANISIIPEGRHKLIDFTNVYIDTIYEYDGKLENDSLAIALPKGSSLKVALNIQINSLKETGQIQQLAEKYGIVETS